MCRGRSDVSRPISREALMMHIIPAYHACGLRDKHEETLCTVPAMLYCVCHDPLIRHQMKHVCLYAGYGCTSDLWRKQWGILHRRVQRSL